MTLKPAGRQSQASVPCPAYNEHHIQTPRATHSSTRRCHCPLLPKPPFSPSNRPPSHPATHLPASPPTRPPAHLGGGVGVRVDAPVGLYKLGILVGQVHLAHLEVQPLLNQGHPAALRVCRRGSNRCDTGAAGARLEGQASASAGSVGSSGGSGQMQERLQAGRQADLGSKESWD